MTFLLYTLFYCVKLLKKKSDRAIKRSVSQNLLLIDRKKSALFVVNREERWEKIKYPKVDCLGFHMI
jgi:hypothetical protein